MSDDVNMAGSANAYIIYVYLPFFCGTDYQFLIRGSMLTIALSAPTLHVDEIYLYSLELVT